MRDALAAARSLSATDPEAAYRVVAKLIRELGRQDTHTLSGLRAEQSRLLEACCTGTSPKANARRVRSWRQPESCPYDAVRVFALSDLHVDQGQNLQKLQAIDTHAFQPDVLIVAGDVADTLEGVRQALQVLRSKFARVVFCAGNHDVWLRPDVADSAAHGDSLAKLFASWDLCDSLDVDTSPMQVAPGVVIVPLNSWYHYSYDTSDPRPGKLRFDRFCQWPVDEVEALWQLMLALNRPAITHTLTAMQGVKGAPCSERSTAERPVVITASHFLPCHGLPFHCSMGAEGAKSVGCLQLASQLDQLGSSVHIHGHTHIPTDMGLQAGSGGVRRHVHCPLDGVRSPKLVCVWDEQQGVNAGYAVDFAGNRVLG